ncbi:hypothetical protein D3C77_562890 [compost metagenome]
MLLQGIQLLLKKLRRATIRPQVLAEDRSQKPAGLTVGDDLLEVGNLLIDRWRPADVEDRVQGSGGCVLDTLPRCLNRAKILHDRASPVSNCFVIGICRQCHCFLMLPLLLKRNNLGIHGCSQIVVLLV